MLQDVPSLVNRSNLSLEAAWNDYNQPIDDLTILHIPSRLAIPRVTPNFYEWWRKSFPELQNSSLEMDVDESAEVLKARNSEGDDGDTSFVPSGSTTNRKSEDYMKIAENFTNKRRKFMKQARENGSKKNKTSKDEMKIAEDPNKIRNYMKQARDKRLKYMKQARYKRLKYMKQARDKRVKYMKQARKNGSKVNRTSKDGIRISEDLNKRRKYMKRVCENDESTMAHFHTQVHSADDEEDDRLSTAQFLRLEKKKKKKKYSTDVKNSGGDTSKQLGKRSRFEVDTNDGEKTFPTLEREQRNKEKDETGIKAGKHMVSSPFNETNSSDPPVSFDGAMDIVESAPETRKFCDDGLDVQTDETGNKAGIFPSPFDENNSSHPSLGASRGVVDIVVSPLETRKTCDDELDVHGSYGSKEPDCLLKEDGIIPGQKKSSDEKLCSSEAKKEDADESLIQKNLAIEELALKAHNKGSSPHQNLACGDETSKAYKNKVLSPSGESNIHIAVGEGSQGQDCLLHDNSLGGEESMKCNKDFEKRNNVFDFDADNGSAKKRIQELKVLGVSIEERIIKAQIFLALIMERRAAELRRITLRCSQL